MNMLRTHWLRSGVLGGMIATNLFAFGNFARAGSDTGPMAPMREHRLELELQSSQYEQLLNALPNEELRDADAVALKPVLDLGKRNLDLLIAVNNARVESDRISLTSKESAQGYPIDQPRIYNVAIILKEHQELVAQVPSPLLSVLNGTGQLGPSLPVTDADYISWGRLIDRSYQSAMRWLTLKPYRPQYIAQRKNDIRGYSTLSHEAELASKLSSWGAQDAATRARLREALVGLCGNSNSLKDCARDLDRLIATHGKIEAFYQRYLKASRKLYDSYFALRWPRHDLVWNAGEPGVLHAPFVDPRDARVASYLKFNIEDEWKWSGWRLSLDFQPQDSGSTAHLIFEPGTTPHVIVAENAIVMDANQPITEYDSQWAIRHEYGHILGFPDCYVEFYDTDNATMVSYQLDITNLMCSRRGVLQQTHFDEMKKHYYLETSL